VTTETSRSVLAHSTDPENEWGRTIAGNKDVCIERPRLWAEIGATRADIKPLYRTLDELMTTMRIIAEEIAPEVEAAPAS
jgi:hypothetical protein